MKKLFFLFYLGLLLIYSCREGRPKEVLSFNDMRAVMWDMMRADQFMADYIFAKDSMANKTMVSSEWYGKILTLHGISQQAFKKSYQYYSEHPKLLKDLMDSVSKQADTSAAWSPRPADSARKDIRSIIAQ